VTGESHVVNQPVAHVKEDLDLVAAQRVRSFGAHCWRRQLTLVARGPVMVEDDFSIEIFKVAHRCRLSVT
jgi:hypothetical protein